MEHGDEVNAMDQYEMDWVEEVAKIEALPCVRQGSVGIVESEVSANLNKVCSCPQTAQRIVAQRHTQHPFHTLS